MNHIDVQGRRIQIPTDRTELTLKLLDGILKKERNLRKARERFQRSLGKMNSEEFNQFMRIASDVMKEHWSEYLP